MQELCNQKATDALKPFFAKSKGLIEARAMKKIEEEIGIIYPAECDGIEKCRIKKTEFINSTLKKQWDSVISAFCSNL